MRYSRLFLTILSCASWPALAGAQNATLDKLTINGYLSQAYARSDSLRAVGITEDGTTDYRRAALLFRYGMSNRETFVLQLAHRRLGDSPSMQLEDNVKVDWAFYQRKLAKETTIRVGKAPIPLGIYNETRYVGTTMPFYRAPFVFYAEGTFTSETIEGVVLSQGLLAESAWRMDIHAYGGSYSLTDQLTAPTPAGPQYMVAESRVKNVVGGQVWMTTPVSGVRVGAGASRFTNTGGLLLPDGQKQSGSNRHVSAEAVFDRFALRAEAMRFRAWTARVKSGYVQGSARLAKSVWLNGQLEMADIRVTEVPVVGTMDVDYERNWALGVNYQPASNLVWKNEIHWSKGRAYEEATIDLSSPAIKGSYVISSLSVSF